MNIKTDIKKGVELVYSDSHPPVFIRKNGRVFIYRKKTTPGAIRFNVFPGEYSIFPEPDNFKFIPFIKKIPHFSLPKAEKTFEGFSEYPRHIRNNDIDYTPARTRIKKNEIETTPRMDGYSEAAINFIICHELGHNIYFTEWKCDLFACYLMAKKGWGLSQCVYAIEDIMHESEAKKQRLKIMLKAIKKFRYG